MLKNFKNWRCSRFPILKNLKGSLCMVNQHYYSTPSAFPPNNWKENDIKSWMRTKGVTEDDIANLNKKYYDQPIEFLKLTQSDLKSNKFSWDTAKKLFYHIHGLRKSLVWPTSYPPVGWNQAQIREWLEEDVALPNEQIIKLERAGMMKDPSKFLEFTESQFEEVGVPWNEAQSLRKFCKHLKKSITSKDGNEQLRFVESVPYPWPYNGKLNRYNTALVIIDMQNDFVDPKGYFGRMGYLNIEIIGNVKKRIGELLDTCRAKGVHVFHTREGHRENLVDLPENKRWRSEKMHAGIGNTADSGDRILTRNCPGWDICQDLLPVEGEILIDKPGKGSFVGTDLEFILQLRKIDNLIFTGVTTDVCVQTTMREANDRGYECVLAEDATSAAFDQMRIASLESIRLSGGIFGTTAKTHEILRALNELPNYKKHN